MAGFTLPTRDFSNQLGQIAQIGNRMRQEKRQNQLGQYVGSALGGDTSALPEIYKLNPDAGIKVQSHLAGIDETRKAQIRADLVDAAGAIVNMPEAQLSAQWPSIRQQIVQKSPELAQELPETYSPVVLATAKGIAGIKPPREQSPTALQQNLADPVTRAYLEQKQRVASQGGGNPSYAPLQGADGFYSFDRRTGQVVPVQVQGQQVVPGSLDPRLQGELTGSRESAKLDVKRKAAKPKVQASLKSAETKMANVVSAVDKALGMVSNFSAGAGAGLSSIPLTTARDLRATLDTIRANVGFAELNEMRANSPTGGALGQVTERELAFLQSTIANIEQSQSPEQLKSNLEKVKQAFQNSVQRLQNAYADEYGSNEQASDASAGGATGGWSITPVE